MSNYYPTQQFGGNGGNPFDDLSATDKEIVGIAAITIRHGTEVDAIQVDYRLSDGGRYTANRHGGNGGTLTSITLEEGETIIGIEGRCGDRIDQLKFTTETRAGDHRTYGPYGGNGGGPFTITDTIECFFGRSGSRLDAIGFYTKQAPAPPSNKTHHEKLKSVEQAFNNVNERGKLHSFDGEPWVPNMAESHVQGIAAYKNFLVVTHSNKGYSTGCVLVLDTVLHRLVQKNSSPDRDFNHPDGMQVIGDYMVVSVENSATSSSYIHFYYLGAMTDTVAPALMPCYIQRTDKGTGCTGITNFTENGGERYLLAAYNDGDLDFYLSNNKTLADNDLAFSFDFNTKLGLDDCASIALLTDEQQNIYLIGLRRGGGNDIWGGEDKAYLYKVDRTNKTLTQLQERHMYTDHGGVVGADGVHFRWGSGVQITSSTSLQMYATQRNFVGGKFYTNTFEAKQALI